MKPAKHILLELEELELSHLLKCSNTMPYAIPQDYFGEECAMMASFAMDSDSEMTFDFPKEIPFAAPSAHYFENLGANIFSKIKDDSMAHLPKENPFAIPSGYFESLPDIIIAKAKAETKMPMRIPLFRTVQLAAAIAMLVFVGLGIGYFNKTNKTNPINISSISKAEITNYVNENIDDFDTDLIVNTLAKNNTVTSPAGELSKEEITNYLNETGWN